MRRRTTTRTPNDPSTVADDTRTYLWKIDLTAAYRQVTIHLLFLWMCHTSWDGQVYLDRRMQFGDKSAVEGRSNLHLMSAIFTVMVSLSGSNFEMMPRKTGASALIAHSDSSLRSARRSYFSSPRGQPCLCCWLVSPPIGERPPSLLRSLFSVPLWVVSALALGASCPSVTSSLP